MSNKSDDFLKKLLATFRIEADEHLKMMSAGLIELESAPAAERYAEIVESAFREAHSLKGAARAVNLREIESVCQSLESVFAALKSKQIAVSTPLFDLMQEAIDNLGSLLSAGGAAMADAGKQAVATLTQRLNDALQGRFAHSSSTQEESVSQEQPPDLDGPDRGPEAAPANENLNQVSAMVTPPAPSPVPILSSETVRVSTQKLGAVMRQVEELLSPRLASAQRASELREAALSVATWKKQRARMRPALRLIERHVEGSGRNNGAASVLQELPKLLEHLESEHLFMNTLEERLLRLSKFAAHDRRTLAGMSDSLLHDVKEMHLLPFFSLLEIFPRFTRELAREQGKQVELVIQGGEIEIDRRTLEEMKDPLMHLLRNCIDHGIELPVARREKQKPAGGTVTVAIAQKDGGKVEIVVADDGAGIDVEKVKVAARRLGLAAAGDDGKLGEREALALVFQSGVSTSPIITDISGRGLGLAIVREKVERLGGMIETETRPGAGTTFRLIVPLTLATFRGVLVRASGQIFVLPLHNVECVVRVAGKDIRTVENRETITFGGQAVALAQLGGVLELPGKNTENEADGSIQAALFGLGVNRIAFQVDEVLGEQEVLVKPLGRQLARVRNVAGACVLGTGQVVPVLNVADLMKSAMQQTAAGRAPVAEKPAETQQRSILVVEDSITSRSLLKNILESAGYRVTTAVDGADAYTTLKTGTFDLIVSDVEMPRMDGFDLTAKVRSDKQLGELPVVLVTALESREHRERGIDVGANAYIVKSSFDQSNLLEVVRRLL